MIWKQYGKKKKFSNKIEVAPEDYENLVKNARKGIVADKVISKLENEIHSLKESLYNWKEKYNTLFDKTKDYFHAIRLAPERVANFFKGLFDKEKQDELQRQRAEQEKIQAEQKAREEAREKAKQEKLNYKNSPEYKKKRRADRDAR